MMCPRDVKPEDFRALLNLAPEGFILKKSRVAKHNGEKLWRDFHFEVTRAIPGYRVGDEAVFTAPCRLHEVGEK